MVRILALAAVASLAIAGASFAAVCPSNYAGASLTSPGGTAYPFATVRDSNCVQIPCLQKHWWYNAAGSAHIEVNAPFCSGEIASGMDFGQYNSDDYVITGPAGPVAFQVFLHLTGSLSKGCHTFCDPFIGCTTSCNYGYVKASLGDGTQSTTTGALQVASVSTDLQLALSKTVGVSFHLDRGLYASSFCSSHSEITSQLEIVLPPGYALTSCYGFTASSPVEALRASWGRVKTLYR